MPLLDPTRRRLDNALLCSPWSTSTCAASDLPAISTSTLPERTTVRVFALGRNDYAGQDPINNYDLNGTCYNGKAGSYSGVARLNLTVAGSRGALCTLLERLATVCLRNNGGGTSGCYEKAAHEACGRMSGHSEGCLDTIWQPEKSIYIGAPWGSVVSAGGGCLTVGAFGAEWGSAVPGVGNVVGGGVGCLIGGTLGWIGADFTGWG